MTKQKNTERVVLNLTQEQAIQLRDFFKALAFDADTKAQEDLVCKLKSRLERTINKNQVIENLRKTGPEPTKEEIKKAMENLK